MSQVQIKQHYFFELMNQRHIRISICSQALILTGSSSPKIPNQFHEDEI